MSFDLQTLAPLPAASEIGHTFEPRYPGADGIGATITVRGPESAAVRELAQRRLTEQVEIEEAARQRGARPPMRSVEAIEADSIELAATYTMRWSGFADGGAPLEPTPANLRRVYREHSWIRRQVIDEAQDLGNFVRAGSTNSSPTPAPNSGST